jgi:type III secretory pathway component EscR
MSKDEIKVEINKVLDQFSDKSLEGLLSFLKNIEDKYSNSIFNNKTLDKFLNEDKDLLDRLDN